MGLLILGSLESIEDSLVIPTQKLTEYIAALFLLLSNSDHTGSDQDYIHNSKYNDYGDGVMLISVARNEYLRVPDRSRSDKRKQAWVYILRFLD